MQNPQSWREYLQSDFANRKRKNARFSLRSYARVLGLSPAHLSQILLGKRQVTAASTLRIADSLGMGPSEAYCLLKSASEGPTASTRTLSEAEFNLISNWQYFAVLGLAQLKQNVADPRWIAKRLNLSQEVSEKLFTDLLAHGYLEVIGRQFRQRSPFLRTKADLPAKAVRHFHRQNLYLAAEKIESVGVSEREYVSMTIPINPKRLKEAKRLIRKFRETFTDEISRGDTSEVYNLSVQFFPLSQVKGSI